ncbi:MAG: putative polymerase sigma factor [Myxococcaceae bacterium]|nr:putative polymerase sigma factor [Myxococcaceae bacterium]
MTEKNLLAGSFEESRAHLRGVAYRMLGSLSEADDAVQETWLRLSRTSTSEIDNLRGWLTTVTARVCLDLLRARKSRAEEPVGEWLPDVTASNAEQEAVLADSVGLALLVVLETLEPAERLAFVLHDLFGISFEEIAPVVGRSPVAARQLASRARRRVRGAPERDETALARQRDLVAALLAALRAGDVEAIVAALAPNIVIHAGGVDGKVREIHGARNWAKGVVVFAQRGLFGAVEAAIIDGAVGAIYAPGGRLSRVLQFTFVDGAITRVDIVVDPERLRALEIAPLEMDDQRQAADTPALK